MTGFYGKLFAGTYYYFLKIENGGKMSDRGYFAISSILLMTVSWALLLWGMSLIWLKGTPISSVPLTVGTGAILVAIHYSVFVRKDRYRVLIKKYEAKRRRLMWASIAVHVSCMSAFFIPAVVIIIRMP